ncbi:MAG: hypothetical protein KF763_18060 [Cyclobacteriaceae bacterium]|nr:hypothetical protein [Cyclobacteriaceae bacterium]
MLTPTDSVVPNFHINQRNRLTISYQSERLKLMGSLQEIHLWVKSGEASTVGSIHFYELYAEPKITDKFSIRIGRQGVLLDNGRIFSDAPWAQQGRSHEGVRLMHKTKNISNDIFLLFTRPYSDYYDRAYSAVASHQYKYMMIHYLKLKTGKYLTISSTSAVEFLEQPNVDNIYNRITTGGRLEWEMNNMYLTLSGYYQLGKNAQQQSIRAYYLQPEVRVRHNKTTLRLGAEILSGNESNGGRTITQNFDISYGVAWKFMGNMNFFARFPVDVGGKGLINPYLFVLHQFHPKFAARTDFHLFANQYRLESSNGEFLNKYLGFENDISFKYKPIKQLELNYGFSYFIAQKEMEELNKIINPEKISVWSYLMISYTFQLLNHSK